MIAAWGLIAPHELTNVPFQKIKEKLLARRTKVMDRLKKKLVVELDKTPITLLAIKEENFVNMAKESIQVKEEKAQMKEEETVVIMVEEGILVKEEKVEMKEEIGLWDLWVKEEVVIEDTLAVNVKTWEKDVRNVNSKEKPFHCNLQGCDKKFGNKGTLKAHIRKLHFMKFESSDDLERQIRALDSQEQSCEM